MLRYAIYKNMEKRDHYFLEIEDKEEDIPLGEFEFLTHDDGIIGAFDLNFYHGVGLCDESLIPLAHKLLEFFIASDVPDYSSLRSFMKLMGEEGIPYGNYGSFMADREYIDFKEAQRLSKLGWDKTD